MNILITDELKEKMEYEKEKTTLLSDMEIDNSALVRAMIWFFYDNEKWLKKLVPYLKKTKGHNMLEEFQQLMEKDVELNEITNKLGIGLDIVKKLEAKQQELEKKKD